MRRHALRGSRTRCGAADQTTAHGNTRQMAMRLAIFCSVVIGAGRSSEGSFGMPPMLPRNDCRAVKPRRSISALAERSKAQTLAVVQQQRTPVAKSCKIQLRLTLYPQVGLATARPPLPPVLGLRVANGLPLHVRNRVRAIAGERDDVIFAVTGEAPVVSPVEGQGCSRWNSRVTSRDRYSLAVTGAETSATMIATMIPPLVNATRATQGAS